MTRWRPWTRSRWSAIRGLLRSSDGELAGQLRAVLARDDDYVTAGKPVCDYEDAAARRELVDALARDARALLGAVDGQELSPVLLTRSRALCSDG